VREVVVEILRDSPQIVLQLLISYQCIMCQKLWSWLAEDNTIQTPFWATL